MRAMKTVVKYTGTTPQYFDFLPPHGRTLQPGQSVEFPGDLVEQASKNDRTWKQLEAALNSGVFHILKTPAPVIFSRHFQRGRALVAETDASPMPILVPLGSVGDYLEESSSSA